LRSGKRRWRRPVSNGAAFMVKGIRAIVMIALARKVW
jgi:hypothetical protein